MNKINVALIFILAVVLGTAAGAISLSINLNSPFSLTGLAVFSDIPKTMDSKNTGKYTLYWGDKKKEFDKLKVPAGEQCYETDPGRDIYMPGIALDIYGTEIVDKCVEFELVKGKLKNPKEVDSCKGKSCKLYESYCKKSINGKIAVEKYINPCPPSLYECIKGRCIADFQHGKDLSKEFTFYQ